jgi:surface polysaccharide O-acyltransferase-like enzyme
MSATETFHPCSDKDGNVIAGTSKKLLFADSLRAFSVLAVILYHSTGAYFYDRSNYLYWLVADVVRSGTSVCVPLFFMLSGMLILDPAKAGESPATFLRKRLSKIFIPFVFWSAVYFILNNTRTGTDFTIVQIFYRIIQGPVHYHMWFMYVLIGLYLSTPLFRLITKSASNEIYIYLLALWLFSEGVLPTLKVFLNIKIDLRAVVMTGYAGYFLAGYYLRDKFLSKKQITVAIFLYAVATLFTAYMTDHFHLSENKDIANYFLRFTTPTVIVMSFCIFLVVKSLNYENIEQMMPTVIKVIQFISSASFGTYLAHALVLDSLRNGSLGFKIHQIGGSINNSIIGIVVTFICTTIATLIFVSILKRIPVVRAVVS